MLDEIEIMYSEATMIGDWKILVYMAADDVLYAAAQNSLRQICGALSGALEVTVQLDGPRPEQASRYLCSGGNKRLVWEAPDGYTKDRRDRLADFLEDVGERHQKSTKYFLVLWGHGAGLDHLYLYNDPKQNTLDGRQPDLSLQGALPDLSGHSPSDATPRKTLREIAGFYSDVLNGEKANHYLKDIELGKVLKKFSDKTRHKIDLLGFDACLMGLAEICHEIRDSTSIVVASDETIPKGSWPYDLILRDLARHPGLDARMLSAILVCRFQERYARERGTSALQLSSLNLDACDDFASAMGELVVALKAEVLDGVSRRKVSRSRDQAQGQDEPAYIDVAIFCTDLRDSFTNGSPVHRAAVAVLRTLSRSPYVIYNRDSDMAKSQQASGLGLYFPDKIASVATLLEGQSQLGLRLYAPLHREFSVGDRKFPPNSGKFPPNSGKFAPNRQKPEPQIKAWEILWDHYIALQFNKDTGWADFVREFVELTAEADNREENSP